MNNSVLVTPKRTSGYLYLGTYGGAIYNGGTIGDITGDFSNNYASSPFQGSYAYGGAI